MTQNVELTRIKAIIKGLSLKTVDQGCSEHEAITAAEKVGELLAQYNLTMDEIDVREQKCVYLDIATGRGKAHPIDNCLTALGHFGDCKVWINRRRNWTSHKKEVHFMFFGQESDTEAVKYLYEVILAAMNHEVAQYKKTTDYIRCQNKKSAHASFLRGMAARVAARLRDLKKENDAALRAAHEARMQDAGEVTEASVAQANTYTYGERKASGVTGTALIALKGQLVEQEFKATGIKLKNSYTRNVIRDWDSYSRGSEAGNKVNLRRPIGQSKVSGLIG